MSQCKLVQTNLYGFTRGSEGDKYNLAEVRGSVCAAVGSSCLRMT